MLQTITFDPPIGRSEDRAQIVGSYKARIGDQYYLFYLVLSDGVLNLWFSNDNFSWNVAESSTPERRPLRVNFHG